MRGRTKIAIGAGAVVLVGILGALTVSAGGGAGPEVRVEEVTRKDLVATVTANGWIRPRRSVDVQADLMGRVVELNVEEGQAVEEGDLLLRIDPTQYEAAVAQAKAGVSEALAQQARAKANRLKAELDLERLLALRRRDSTLVSQQAVDEAETQAKIQRALHEAAKHTVEKARAALREAQDRLAKTVIRAPITGVVTRLNVEEGETAIVGTMNNPGSLLLTISDLSSMEAVVHVDETDVTTVALGDSAAVTIDAFPRRTFTGRVTEVGHSAVRSPETLAASGQEAQAVDFEVVITLDDPPPVLRPDLSATADVVTDTRTDALSIPIIALTVREREAADSIRPESAEARATLATLNDASRDQEGVFIVNGGTVRFVPVEVGVAGQEYFEVVAGLAEGDSVVAGPYEAIRELEDGDPIRIQAGAAGKESDEEGEAS